VLGFGLLFPCESIESTGRGEEGRKEEEWSGVEVGEGKGVRERGVREETREEKHKLYITLHKKVQIN
jgi:hypothetical protein